MKRVSITVPEDFAKKTLASELNSYAYNTSNQALVYLREFSYGSNGKMQTAVEMYPMKQEEPLSKYFTLGNHALPGMKVIDCEGLKTEKMNEMMNNLMDFCEKTTCVKSNVPLFDISQVPEEQMEDDSDWEDPPTPFGPGIKPEPGDIVIPIPAEPLHFENPGKFDEE